MASKHLVTIATLFVMLSARKTEAGQNPAGRVSMGRRAAALKQAEEPGGGYPNPQAVPGGMGQHFGGLWRSVLQSEGFQEGLRVASLVSMLIPLVVFQLHRWWVGGNAPVRMPLASGRPSLTLVPFISMMRQQAVHKLSVSVGLPDFDPDDGAALVLSMEDGAPPYQPPLMPPEAAIGGGHPITLDNAAQASGRYPVLPDSTAARPFSLTTLNVHAPIHKRIAGGRREASERGRYLPRNRRIMNLLLSDPATIVCLQEFWVCSNEMVSLYEAAFAPAGYDLYLTSRTNCRGDGLVTMVARDHFQVLGYQSIELQDCADRVAQLLHVKALGSAPGEEEMLVVNTHLMFPHDRNAKLIRLRQCAKLLAHIQQYAMQHSVAGIPIIIAGDWNGETDGAVARFMRSQGFVSTYDELNADKGRWVSHLTHHGKAVGVDYVWLLNPSDQCGSLTSHWQQLVCGCITAELLSRGITTTEAAFGYFDSCNRGFITPASLRAGLKELRFLNEEGIGLLENEIEELAKYMDTNQDGVIEREEFSWLLDMTGEEALLEACGGDVVEFVLKYAANHAQCPMHTETFHADLCLLEASFPDSCANGIWPETYCDEISDHAPLSVKFGLTSLRKSFPFASLESQLLPTDASQPDSPVWG